ncbi:hypothetical protein [Pedobacter caeni]|uniref:Zinc-finger n=1 Tax=Pedobacter caeni TaxID=288992 RepID=A0A1M4YW90_9SPHI|nr:hypothetical protein [Pedobacter caeni]SHF09995.1 hypothetical protein SAMN04488522_10290 [Pedobacter caeni]
MKKKIIHLILLSCKKATELIEKKSLFGLSWIEKTQLRLHTNVCDGCTIYQQQSILLDEAVKGQFKNDALKQRILSSLDNETGLYPGTDN